MRAVKNPFHYVDSVGLLELEIWGFGRFLENITKSFAEAFEDWSLALLEVFELKFVNEFD